MSMSEVAEFLKDLGVVELHAYEQEAMTWDRMVELETETGECYTASLHYLGRASGMGWTWLSQPPEEWQLAFENRLSESLDALEELTQEEGSISVSDLIEEDS